MRATPYASHRPLYRRRNPSFWDFSCRNLIFVLVLIFIGYKLLWWSSTKKCVTFPLSDWDVSDQLLELCAGVSLAWKIGRNFHISKAWRHKNAEKATDELKSWFPRLRERIKEMPNDVSPWYVPFTLSILQNKEQLANERKECLQMDKEYRYDAELFHEYQRDLRYLLEFSEEVHRVGKNVLEHLNLKKKYTAVCVHIGKDTVADAQSDPSKHEIVKAVREIAINHHLNEFYLFSDDKNFARAIMVTLQINENWQPHVHVANFSRIMDLYVAQHVCGAVVLTSSRSAHGWWLGFLAPLQLKVHYMRLDSDDEAGVQMFLPSWTQYRNWKKGRKEKDKPLLPKVIPA
ncbi:hypothetical protein Y032_0003g1417 [Ancylostoma ceylanicum]|uniref:L-Fucosyltransferase n=1 Tax=Ancylostoma ceylanicum TaxID=53326 RepID=A0A016VZF6_9BILA|nr:hypothetical protein Y032_0003g1417 [Ancylostoma ceylanicum]